MVSFLYSGEKIRDTIQWRRIIYESISNILKGSWSSLRAFCGQILIRRNFFLVIIVFGRNRAVTNIRVVVRCWHFVALRVRRWLRAKLHLSWGVRLWLRIGSGHIRLRNGHDFLRLKVMLLRFTCSDILCLLIGRMVATLVMVLCGASCLLLLLLLLLRGRSIWAIGALELDRLRLDVSDVVLWILVRIALSRLNCGRVRNRRLSQSSWHKVTSRGDVFTVLNRTNQEFELFVVQTTNTFSVNPCGEIFFAPLRGKWPQKWSPGQFALLGDWLVNDLQILLEKIEKRLVFSVDMSKCPKNVHLFRKMSIN